MTTTFYMGVIGTDGNHCVFWGVGSGDTLEAATEAARSDAEQWLEDDEMEELQECEIDRATYETVLAGNPYADDFVETTTDGWRVRPVGRVSLDNGRTYLNAADVPSDAIERHCGALIEAMDDNVREAVHSAAPFSTDAEFLSAYLLQSRLDLVIG